VPRSWLSTIAIIFFYSDNFLTTLPVAFIGYRDLDRIAAVLGVKKTMEQPEQLPVPAFPVSIKPIQ